MDEDLIAISESTKRQKYIDFYKRNKKKNNIIYFLYIYSSFNYFVLHKFSKKK